MQSSTMFSASEVQGSDFLALLTHQTKVDASMPKIQFTRGMFLDHEKVLNNGFSLSMWVKFLSLSEKDTNVINIQRNVSFCSLRIGMHNKKFQLTLRNSKDVEETYYSEKQLKQGQWYNLVVIGKKLSPTMHSISLYVNGYLDLDASAQNLEPFDSCQVLVGGYRKLEQTPSIWQNLILFLFPVNEDEVQTLNSEESAYLKVGTLETHVEAIKTQSDYIQNTEKYLVSNKTIPGKEFMNLEVHDEFFGTSQEEGELGEQFFDPCVPLGQILNDINNIKLRDKLIEVLLPGKYEFLLKCLGVMVNGDMSLAGAIEVDRFLVPFKNLKSQLTRQELYFLAQESKFLQIEVDGDEKFEYITFHPFLRTLRRVLYDVTELFEQRNQYFNDMESRFMYEDEPSDIQSEIDPEEIRRQEQEAEEERRQQIIKKCSIYDEIETNSFQDIEDGYEEVTVIEEEEEEEVPKTAAELYEEEENAEEERLIGKLDLDPNWNMGKIEVNINRCDKCFQHFNYSRHSEDEHVQMFNDVGDMIGGVFPSANIIGNQEKVSCLGEFEVYLRGAGFKDRRDNLDRFILFRKSHKNRFPVKEDILDQLICIVFLYGDSNKMELEQTIARETYRFPKYKGIHQHPCDMPDKIIRQPTNEKESPPSDLVLVCHNWGCDQEFMPDRNNKFACTHHPGRFEFGSERALWPEGWTCCRKAWDEPGCRQGYHRGQPKERQAMQCIHHGEPNPNPKNPYPDSFCGKTFIFKDEGGKKRGVDEDAEPCVYHPGHFQLKNPKSSDGKWTCCQEDLIQAKGCQEDVHEFAQWPDENAKKYFYDKPIQNPAETWNAKPDSKSDFEKYGRLSGFFRNPLPYEEHNPSNPNTLSADEQRKQDNKPRVCLNWACQKIYKDNNNKKNACLCHPGRWDFGYSGLTVSKAMRMSGDDYLWEAHWTCCRKGWKEEGCTRTYHRGPFQDVYNKNPPKYVYPDERVKTVFKKVCSSHWQTKMENQYNYDAETLKFKLQKYSSVHGSGGKIRIDDVPELCDFLGLHLLMNSNDMSFHFKFHEVVNHECEKFFEDPEGNIDFAKFIQWWSMDIDQLLTKYDVPPEQVKPEDQKP